MVIIGAAMNHWYHADMNYRGVINMLVMCGCVGPVRRRLGALCRAGEAAPAGRLGAARLRARLGPPAAPAELDLVLLRAHRPVALRDDACRATSSRRPRRPGRGMARSSTTTSAPSAWAGCRRRRSCAEPARRSPGMAAAAGHGGEGLCRQGAEGRHAEASPARIRTTRRTGRATCSSGAPTCSARPARATSTS